MTERKQIIHSYIFSRLLAEACLTTWNKTILMRNAIKITALKYYLQYDIYLMKNNSFHIYLVPNLVMDRESEMGAENKQDIKDFTPKAGEG